MDISTIIAQNIEDTPSKLVDLQLFLDNINSGSGLGGTNYVFVRGNGTPQENATELQAAYDTAKTMPRYLGYIDETYSATFYKGQTFYSTYLPGAIKVLEDYTGVFDENTGMVFAEITEAEAKSTRTTVVVAPGEYTVDGDYYDFNANSVNVVSLTGKPDVIFNGSAVVRLGDTSSNRVSLFRGLNSQSLFADMEVCPSGITFENCVGGNFSFFGAGGSADGTFINCTGGDYSFGGEGLASGTFINCIGGEASFGGLGGTASGTFKNCEGGDNSFGGEGTASGIFENCTGGVGSFGGGSGNASGTFNHCTGGDGSFGGTGGTASGTFINCTGGDNSFGTSGTASGTFENCTGGSYSFGGDNGTASGTFKNCEGGNYSFGGGGIVSGTFTNCTGGTFSFGGGGGIVSGTFTNCTGGTFSFGGGGGGVADGTFTNCVGGSASFGGSSGTASGMFTNCVGGSASFGGGGTASGNFNYCVGDLGSFGANGGPYTGVLSGKLYYCKLIDGTFQTPQAGGKLVLCIDGTDSIVTTA